MNKLQQFSAIVERDGDEYISLCSQLDVASQGETVEEARANLIEALELLFAVANPAEIPTKSLSGSPWHAAGDHSTDMITIFAP